MKLKHLAMATLPFILMCSLTGCGTTKINVNQYLSTEFRGYDGYGSGFCYVDLDLMVRENHDAFGLEDGYSAMDYQWVIEHLETMGVSLDKTAELANGETIKVQFEPSSIATLEDTYGIKLEVQDTDVTVTGLDELTELNIFDNITVQFDGIEPNAYVTIDKSELDSLGLSTSGLDIKATPDSKVKNGDKVTVAVSKETQDYLLNNGYQLTETTREYTVEGLDAYLMSLDELPAEASEKMEQNGKDVLNAEIASYWDNPAALDSINAIGNYLLTLKKDDGYLRSHNYLIYVYEIKTIDGFTYYSYVQYSDIKNLGDGTCSFDLNLAEKPVGNISFGMWGAAFEHEGLCFIGYADLDTLFNDAVTQHIDLYDYQSTVS